MAKTDSARPSKIIRSFNQSSIPIAAVQQYFSASDTLSASATDLPLEPASLSLAQNNPIPTSKQIGSVPAVGSGPGAASIEAAEIDSANTKPPEPISTSSAISSAPSLQSIATLSFSANGQEASAPAPSKQVGSVPAVGSGPGAASIEADEIDSANTKPPQPISTPSVVALANSLQPTPTSSLSANGQIESILAPSKQVGSVPAVGSGPGAASIEADEIDSANTIPPQPISTSSADFTGSLSSSATISSLPSSVSTQGAAVNPTSKQAGSAPTAGDSVGATSKNVDPIVSNPASSTPPTALGTGTPLQIIPVSKVSQTKSNVALTSTPSPAQSPIALPSSALLSVTVTSPSLQLTSSESAPPTITDGSQATNGNSAMAKSFNEYFDSISLNSACSAAIGSQASVCIDGKPASCGANGQYVVTSCPQGQQCRAVPLKDGKSGVSVQCTTEIDDEAAPDQGSLSASPTVFPNPQSQGSGASIGTQPISSLSTKVNDPQPTGLPTGGPSNSRLELTAIESRSIVPSEAATSKIVATSPPIGNIGSLGSEKTQAQTSTQTQPQSQDVRSADSSSLVSSIPTKSETPPAENPSATTSNLLPEKSDQPAIVIVPETRKPFETASGEPILTSSTPIAGPPTANAVKLLTSSAIVSSKTVVEIVTVTMTVNDRL